LLLFVIPRHARTQVKQAELDRVTRVAQIEAEYAAKQVRSAVPCEMMHGLLLVRMRLSSDHARAVRAG
jgi:hypothetical protein